MSEYHKNRNFGRIREYPDGYVQNDYITKLTDVQLIGDFVPLQSWVTHINQQKKQKVIFKGTMPFWFSDMIKNGNDLKLGAEYTISSKEALPSWTKITLEETGLLEYNLAWFENAKSSIEKAVENKFIV